MILGFPADDVAGQEPRSDAQIAEFCKANFGVSFPMFAKSNVVSEPINPLFERLDAAAGPPSWNFNKYLLDRDGEVVEHYDVGDRARRPGADRTHRPAAGELSRRRAQLDWLVGRIRISLTSTRSGWLSA